MLTHPTTDRLRELGLVGMARALEEQRRQPDSADLGFEDRLAMLVDREALERDTKRLAARLRFAGLREQATPEDVDYRAARGLDRPVPAPDRRRVDRAAPEFAGDREDRHRKNLALLRPRSSRLPRQPLGAVSTRAPAAGERLAWPEVTDAMPAC